MYSSWPAEVSCSDGWDGETWALGLLVPDNKSNSVTYSKEIVVTYSKEIMVTTYSKLNGRATIIFLAQVRTGAGTNCPSVQNKRETYVLPHASVFS